MTNVKALPTAQTDPRQALLQAMEHVDEIGCVAIVYMPKDGDLPKVTSSSMSPIDMNFLGAALQQMAFRFIEEG